VALFCSVIGRTPYFKLDATHVVPDASITTALDAFLAFWYLYVLQKGALMAKRIGRPPKDEASKKGEHLSIRMSSNLRRLLDDARHRPDGARSLSQEIELRLWQTFTAQKDMEERFGGADTARFLHTMANCIRKIETRAGGDHHWLDNRFVFDQVRIMLNVILDYFQPRGRHTMPRLWRLLDPALRKDFENMGRRQAITILAMLKIAADKDNMPAVLPPTDLKLAADELAPRIRGTPLVEYEAMAKRSDAALSRASSKRRIR